MKCLINCESISYTTMCVSFLRLLSPFLPPFVNWDFFRHHCTSHLLYCAKCLFLISYFSTYCNNILTTLPVYYVLLHLLVRFFAINHKVRREGLFSSAWKMWLLYKKCILFLIMEINNFQKAFGSKLSRVFLLIEIMTKTCDIILWPWSIGLLIFD